MSDSLVQLSQDERGVARITLSDAQRFNALSSEMLVALQSALDSVAKNEQAHARLARQFFDDTIQRLIKGAR